jgi:hypothetical protein
MPALNRKIAIAAATASASAHGSTLANLASRSAEAEQRDARPHAQRLTQTDSMRQSRTGFARLD